MPETSDLSKTILHMLIIHPPLTKPCEPPAALAYLCAALAAHGHSCSVCDMNIEALEYIFATATCRRHLVQSGSEASGKKSRRPAAK